MARGSRDSKIDRERERERKKKEQCETERGQDQPAQQLPMLSSCLSNLPLASIASCLLASCRFYVDISSTLIKCVDFNVFLIFHAYPWRIFRCCCCCCRWPTGSGWAAARKFGKASWQKGCKWGTPVCPLSVPTSCSLSSSSLFCFVLFSLNDRITARAFWSALALLYPV